MSDPIDRILVGSSLQELLAESNALKRKLPLDVRKRFNEIYIHYMHYHGPDGTFERLNNRSIATILAEHHPEGDPEPMASGEAGGVRWRLFEAPGRVAEPPGPDPAAAGASGPDVGG